MCVMSDQNFYLIKIFSFRLYTSEILTYGDLLAERSDGAAAVEVQEDAHLAHLEDQAVLRKMR